MASTVHVMNTATPTSGGAYVITPYTSEASTHAHAMFTRASFSEKRLKILPHTRHMSALPQPHAMPPA